jgi:hypothetical protein
MKTHRSTSSIIRAHTNEQPVHRKQRHLHSRLLPIYGAAEKSLRYATREREALRPNLRSLHYFSEDAARLAMRLILEAGTGRRVNDVHRNCLLVIWKNVGGPALNGNPEAWDFPCDSLTTADLLLLHARILLTQSHSALECSRRVKPNQANRPPYQR